MVELIKSDLLALGIKHDSYFFKKKNYTIKIKLKNRKFLKEKGLIYEGKLEVKKTEKKGVGALPEGYSSEDQTLFKSTLFGDDQDRVVKNPMILTLILAPIWLTF